MINIKAAIVAVAFGFSCAGVVSAHEAGVIATQVFEQQNIITYEEEENVVYEAPEASDGHYYLGTCLVSAYCACEQCCGKSDGITATGTYATQGRTVAVDPSVIPYGSTVHIDGVPYVAEDCGGAIGGTRIDLFFNSHQDALNWGVRYCEVWIG